MSPEITGRGNHMGRKRGTQSQARRMKCMMRLLVTRPRTIKELMEEFGISRRQVLRDIKQIDEDGNVLEYNREDREVTYRLDPAYKGIPPIDISPYELTSLHLAKSHLAYLEGTPFLDDLERVISKVKAALPDRVANHLDRIIQMVVPLHRPHRHYGSQSHTIETLRKALLLQRRVVVRYRSPEDSNPNEFRFAPCTLILYQDGLYVRGWSHRAKEMRTLAVERIKQVTLTDERFEIPQPKTGQDYLSTSFGVFEGPPEKVTIQFKKDVAYLLKERQWHSSQRLTRLKNGAVILEMRVGGMEEVCSWVLSWGPYAKVLSPPSLVKMVATELQAAARQYQAPPQK
jgi:predicted DNA-binding transcriptional regulator YafY